MYKIGIQLNLSYFFDTFIKSGSWKDGLIDYSVFELKEKADKKVIFMVDLIMFSVSIVLFVCFNLFYWFWS